MVNVQCSMSILDFLSFLMNWSTWGFLIGSGVLWWKDNLFISDS
jgi:hypothetical protein